MKVQYLGREMDVQSPHEAIEILLAAGLNVEFIVCQNHAEDPCTLHDVPIGECGWCEPGSVVAYDGNVAAECGGCIMEDERVH